MNFKPHKVKFIYYSLWWSTSFPNFTRFAYQNDFLNLGVAILLLVAVALYHFRGQSSRRVTFGHTGCWSIAKCRFSAKFSKSFDHHGKTRKEMFKKEFRKRPREKPELPRRSVSNFNQAVFDYVLENACVKVGKEMFASCTYALPRSHAIPRMENTEGKLNALQEQKIFNKTTYSCNKQRLSTDCL